MSNLPEREELVETPEDKIKITEEPIQKMANASNFILIKEDHTMGNAIRW